METTKQSSKDKTIPVVKLFATREYALGNSFITGVAFLFLWKKTLRPGGILDVKLEPYLIASKDSKMRRICIVSREKMTHFVPEETCRVCAISMSAPSHHNEPIPHDREEERVWTSADDDDDEDSGSWDEILGLDKTATKAAEATIASPRFHSTVPVVHPATTAPLSPSYPPLMHPNEQSESLGEAVAKLRNRFNDLANATTVPLKPPMAAAAPRNEDKEAPKVYLDTLSGQKMTDDAYCQLPETPVIWHVKSGNPRRPHITDNSRVIWWSEAEVPLHFRPVSAPVAAAAAAAASTEKEEPEQTLKKQQRYLETFSGLKMREDEIRQLRDNSGKKRHPYIIDDWRVNWYTDAEVPLHFRPITAAAAAAVAPASATEKKEEKQQPEKGSSSPPLLATTAAATTTEPKPVFNVHAARARLQHAGAVYFSDMIKHGDALFEQQLAAMEATMTPEALAAVVKPSYNPRSLLEKVTWEFPPWDVSELPVDLRWYVFSRIQELGFGHRRLPNMDAGLDKCTAIVFVL